MLAGLKKKSESRNKNVDFAEQDAILWRRKQLSALQNKTKTKQIF